MLNKRKIAYSQSFMVITNCSRVTKRSPPGVMSWITNVPLIIINREQNYIPQIHVHLEQAQTILNYNNIQCMQSLHDTASFDILERIPAIVREATRRRRAALVRIFSYLDMTSLCMTSQVCREWRLVSRSPNLWRVVKVENVCVSENVSYL